MKRKLFIILALMALLTLLCCGAAQADDPTPVLIPGEATEVTITTGGEIAYFSFVPEQSGTRKQTASPLNPWALYPAPAATA